MKKVEITPKAIQKFKKGANIILEQDLVTKIELNEFVNFINTNGRIIGTGYLGKENKGLGWFLCEKNQKIDQKFYQKCLERAKEERSIYFQKIDETNAFRLFNGIADGIGGLTIDYYNEYAVISLYNRTITKHLDYLLNALIDVYPNLKGIYVKYRYANTKKETELAFGVEAPTPLLIKENNVTFATYLNEGFMTGIFLDQHEVRQKLVDGQACGMNVLNLFSYTGAFSVAAAMGGSLSTTSVDLAKRSLSKTKEMFKVNGLAIDDQKIIVMDTFDFCKWAQKKGLKYDMIILDPPSFARNGKKTWSVAKDYGRLILAILPLLEKNGICIASTNAANVSEEKFKNMVEESFKQAKRDYKLQSINKLPADFKTVKRYPLGDYLKVLTYQVD